MKRLINIRNSIVEVACYSHIILFTYAAVSKIIDYGHFEIEIAKSPLLSAFAAIVPMGVIITELLIALLLLHPRLRFYGLLASLWLMSCFATYIIIILNWSSFIPCSCGGVLSQLGWWEHLAFNIFFVLLGFTAICVYPQPSTPQLFRGNRKLFPLLIFILLSSVIVVASLYILSEEKTHRNNAFIRRYPHSPAQLIKGFSIKYNSYYIAGENKGIVYLGNITAPSHVLAVNSRTGRVEAKTISLSNPSQITMSAPKVRIHGSTFFVFDAAKPLVFKGDTASWEASLDYEGTEPYVQLEPTGTGRFIFSKISNQGNQHTIGVLDVKTGLTKVADKLLIPQSKDIFDTDGMLLYNSDMDRLFYVYYYRNQFVSSTLDLKEPVTGKSIDTITKAIVPVARENKGRIRTIASPPLVVHKQSCTAGQYLFIKSVRLGRYEAESMLKDAAIIDVYDTEQQTYEFSFYLYNYKDEEVRTFKVYDDMLVGLTDHYVVFYKLDQTRFRFMNRKNNN